MQCETEDRLSSLLADGDGHGVISFFRRQPGESPKPETQDAAREAVTKPHAISRVGDLLCFHGDVGDSDAVSLLLVALAVMRLCIWSRETCSA